MRRITLKDCKLHMTRFYYYLLLFYFCSHDEIILHAPPTNPNTEGIFWSIFQKDNKKKFAVASAVRKEKAFKKSSGVWNHFQIYIENNESFVKCIYCAWKKKWKREWGTTAPLRHAHDSSSSCSYFGPHRLQFMEPSITLV